MASLRLPPLPTVRDIIKLYKLRALKQLSQNFLLDKRITDKIVRSAGKITDGEVCEVGPGPGSITRSILMKRPNRLLLVEKDPRFIPTLDMLAEAVSPIPVDIVVGDVLSFNMEKAFDEEKLQPWTDKPPNIHIVGNLPFSISTPLIIQWLRAISERRSAWRYGRVRMTLTFQKEVAERMVAPILSKSRCRLSVMCQNWCSVQHKFTIKGSAFVPPPDVEVGVVVFEPLVRPIIELPFKVVEKVTRCVFSFRQKYCIRGVQTLFPPGCREKFSKLVLEEAEIDPVVRPFMLTVSDMGRICRAYVNIVSEDPLLAKYEYRLSKHEKYIEEDEQADGENEEVDEGKAEEKVIQPDSLFQPVSQHI